MTTIACDGKSMAGDGFSVQAYTVCCTSAKKLFRHDGSVFGCCGRFETIQTFQNWIEGGQGDFPQMNEEFSAMELRPDGTLWEWGQYLTPFPIEVPSAIGSGWKFGYAALKLGMTSVQAVEFAATLDVNTGGTIMVEVPDQNVANANGK